MSKIRLIWQQKYSYEITYMTNRDLFYEYNDLLDNYLGIYNEKDPKFSKKIDWKYDMVSDELQRRLRQCCFYRKHRKKPEESNEKIFYEHLDFRAYNKGSLDFIARDELIRRLKKCGFFNNRYVIIEKVIKQAT